MKNLLLPLVLVFASSICVAQVTTIEFGYDDAGNRISRTVQTSKQMQYTTVQSNSEVAENDKQNDQEVIVSMAVIMYPNPATEQFTVELKNYDGTVLTYEIHGINGGLIDQGQIQRAKTLFDTRSFGKGVYFIRLEGASMRLTKQLVIK